LIIVGVILFVITYMISTYHEIDHSEIGFRYDYITGISMLIVFITSFVLFDEDKIKESKSKNKFSLNKHEKDTDFLFLLWLRL